LADISIRRSHQRSPEQVQATIEKLAEKMVERLGGSWCWQGNTAVCELWGAEARVGYDEQRVWIEVTLPRALKPLRGRLEGQLEEHFERYFGKP
jgi:putative polyhydroxyalkanoate system protein